MRYPWRFQADIAYGDPDPLVTVFMGELVTDESGVVSVRQDTGIENKVTMRLSELESAVHLADPKLMAAVDAQQKQARLDAKAAAEPPADLPMRERFPSK